MNKKIMTVYSFIVSGCFLVLTFAQRPIPVFALDNTDSTSSQSDTISLIPQQSSCVFSPQKLQECSEFKRIIVRFNSILVTLLSQYERLPMNTIKTKVEFIENLLRRTKNANLSGSKELVYIFEYLDYALLTYKNSLSQSNQGLAKRIFSDQTRIPRWFISNTELVQITTLQQEDSPTRNIKIRIRIKNSLTEDIQEPLYLGCIPQLQRFLLSIIPIPSEVHLKKNAHTTVIAYFPYDPGVITLSKEWKALYNCSFVYSLHGETFTSTPVPLSITPLQ